MVEFVNIIKKYRKKASLLILLCLVTGALGGCGSEWELLIGEQDAMTEPMEATPVIDYTVPELTPNILVNRNGYQYDRMKRAAVKGKKLPKSFRLIDCDTGEEVYSGNIEDITYDSEQKLYSGYIVFGEFEKEGSYYLECDEVGRSYSFSIEASLYERLFTECYDEVVRACNDGTAGLEDAMSLLLVYEWSPEICEDRNNDNVPDVFQILQEWILQTDYSQLDMTEGAMQAAFLAKYSYLYQNYDLNFATECLQRASTIFSQTQNTIQKDGDNFWALTELYRATGLSTYGNQIVDYKAFFEKNKHFLEENGYLYGCMTYMVTRQNVDVELCELVMNQLLGLGEEMSEQWEELLHPIHARHNGVEDLLKRSAGLTCSNYVLESYQNDYILEEILHYLMGRNFRSVSFYPSEEVDSAYLLLLAQLASSEREDAA